MLYRVRPRPMDCKNEAHYRALLFLDYLSLWYTPEADVKKYAESYLYWLSRM